MITSTSNQQVKEVQKLQKSSRYRSEKGLFVVEGWRMIKEIPAAFVVSIFMVASDATGLVEIELDKVTLVTDQVLKAMSREVTPQGIIGIAKMKSMAYELTEVENPLIVAIDCVQDPGNLGTIIRTAEAAGVDQLILSKGTVDLYNPKVVKSTMGAIYRMAILKDVDLGHYLDLMSESNIAIYAAHLNGVKNHYQFNYQQGTCFVMGNEGNGLREEIAEKTTDYLKIPMQSKAESLNVAMATGILIYEAIRQRLQ